MNNEIDRRTTNKSLYPKKAISLIIDAELYDFIKSSCGVLSMSTYIRNLINYDLEYNVTKNARIAILKKELAILEGKENSV